MVVVVIGVSFSGSCLSLIERFSGQIVINVKKLQFRHVVNDKRSNTAKITKR